MMPSEVTIAQVRSELRARWSAIQDATLPASSPAAEQQALRSQRIEVEPLATSVIDTDGVAFVPAFVGLGSPYWDPYARGTIVGLTRGTTKAHLVRAAVEAMAQQSQDVMEAMAATTGSAPTELRVSSDVAILGRIGELGQALIARQADKVLAGFADCLRRTVTAR